MEVRISGVMLASIMADLAIAGRDIEGLLYGTVVQRNTKTIDDSDTSGTTSKTSQYVVKNYTKCLIGSDLIPTLFYDGTGVVDKVVINNMSHLPQQGLTLIGWFKARVNTPLRTSARELAVTRSLGANIKSAPPLFALFTLSHPNNIKTFGYRFFIGDHTTTAVPLVTNLVSSSQVEYREFDVQLGMDFSGDKTINTTLNSNSLATLLENNHSTSLTKLQELSQQITATYSECSELEREIALLRSKQLATIVHQ